MQDFNYIYETYYHRVFRAAFSLTKDQGLAEDVLQESFLKAYHKLHLIEDEAKVGAWLTTIAKRTAIDLLRKEKRTPVLSLEETCLPENQIAFSESAVEKEIEENDFRQGIKEKINTLPTKLRKVFQLKYYGELQEKEIASALKLTNSAVKSRLFRARNNLKTKVVDLAGDQSA